MADIVYGVEVQYLQSGSLSPASVGLDKLNSKTSEWGKSLFGAVEGFTGKFNSAFDSIVGSAVEAGASIAATVGGGLAAGLMVATKVAFDFNSEIEQTTISLAAISNANGTVDNFAGGMRLAGDVLKEMRLDAAKLPGEFRDLAGIMATVMSPLSQQGIGMFGAEKLASQIMAAAAVLHVPMNVAGREMAMMLEGNARHQMPFFNRLNLGVDTRTFNAMAPDKRLELVRSSLDKLNPAIEEFKNSWKGISTTAIDKIRFGIGQVGGPLFQSIKTGVDYFNTRFVNDNRSQLENLGQALGDGLDNAAHRGADAIKHWYPIVRDFSVNMYEHMHDAWTRVEPLIERVLGRVESFMKDPAAFQKMEHFLGELIALRMGMGTLQLGASMGPSFLSMFGGGAGGVAAFGEALPIAIAAVAAFALAVYGVTSAVADTESAFHDLTTTAVGKLVQDTSRLSNELTKPASVFTKVSEALGYAVVTIADTWVNSMYYATLALNTFADGLITNINTIFGLSLKLNSAHEKPNRDQVPLYHVEEMESAADREKDRKAPIHNTTIHKVEINVNSNQDPNRVAKKTKDLLMDEVARTFHYSGNPRLSR